MVVVFPAVVKENATQQKKKHHVRHATLSGLKRDRMQSEQLETHYKCSCCCHRYIGSIELILK